MAEPSTKSPETFPKAVTGAPNGLSSRDAKSSWRSPARRLASWEARPALPLFSLLALLYAGAVTFVKPGFSAPFETFVHLLALLGTAVVFFGLWDWLALLGFRHLLRRDRETLWRKYGCLQTFRRRLHNASFEHDADLAGGLVTAALRRFIALGRPQGDFISRQLAVIFGEARIGSATLEFAGTAAPLIGLLGTLVGLQSVLGPSPTIEPGALPGHELGSTLFSAVLGIAISAVAVFFSQWLSGPVVADCLRILAPVTETARTGNLLAVSSTAPVAAFDKATESRMSAWQRSAWSPELRRYRNASFLAAWVVTGFLIAVFVSGG